MEQHLEAIRQCYRAAQASLSTEIALEWTIDTNGKVSGLRIVGEKKDVKAFEQCLIELAKQWRFPRPTGSGKARVAVVLSY